VVTRDGPAGGAELAPVVPGEVTTQHLPARPHVRRAVDVLRADPEDVGVVAAPVNREGPVEAGPERGGAHGPPVELGPDGVLPVLLRLPVVEIRDVVRIAPSDRTRGHDVVLVVRLDRDVAALAAARLDPVALRDRADRRAAGDADRRV